MSSSENSLRVSIIRSFISPTALFVNVMAKIFLNRSGCLSEIKFLNILLQA